jgi:hypothetical protein
MFIENKYYQWYFSIIENAKSREVPLTYTEKHHIIPRSLGGNDTEENLVILTAREHFICHILLTKFTKDQAYYKMVYASLGMRRTRDYQHRYINARLYETIKQESARMQSERFKGKKLSDEHRAKISAGLTGRINSPETIKKRAESLRGKKLSDEQKQRLSEAQKNRVPYIYTDEEKEVISKKISNALKGKPKSEEHKKKLSEINKGKIVGPRSEETKQKMRKPKSAEHCKAISEARKAKYAAIRAAKEQ